MTMLCNLWPTHQEQFDVQRPDWGQEKEAELLPPILDWWLNLRHSTVRSHRGAGHRCMLGDFPLPAYLRMLQYKPVQTIILGWLRLNKNV